MMLPSTDNLRQSGAIPHWFGLGFVQLKITDRTRYHFWHPSLSADVLEEEVHDHRYDFKSVVLKGAVDHQIYNFRSRPSVSGSTPTHEMVYVSCDQAKPAPNHGPDHGFLEEIGTQTISSGSSYTFKQGRFHRTGKITTPTITYIERCDVKTEFARVIRPIGQASVCPFSNPKPVSELWEIIDAMLPKAPGYHMTDIKKGVLGEPSKILEEVEEFIDATAQGVDIMALVELSDLVGAIEAYLQNKHPTINLDDLRDMSRITSRAFQNGRR